jgi:hypothetical protein
VFVFLSVIFLRRYPSGMTIPTERPLTWAGPRAHPDREVARSSDAGAK